MYQTFQIEQEMELILEKRSVTATAEIDWKVKWAPAINNYVKTLKGKQYKQNEQMIEERGMCICMLIIYIYRCALISMLHALCSVSCTF